MQLKHTKGQKSFHLVPIVNIHAFQAQDLSYAQNSQKLTCAFIQKLMMFVPLPQHIKLQTPNLLVLQKRALYSRSWLMVQM